MSDLPDPLAVELLSLRAWPASRDEDIEGWRLRVTGGFTKRANSVTPLTAHPPAETLRLVETCEEAYVASALPAVFRLTPFAGPEVDRVLAGKGYALVEPSQVMVLPLAEEAARQPQAEFVLSEDPSAAWLDAWCTYAGKAAAREAMAAMARRMPKPRVFVLLRDGDATVACGTAVLTENVVFLFDLAVDPILRRRGYGTMLVETLCRWGRSRGARHGCLQVIESNTAASTLYQKLGFRNLGPYHYRVKTDS